jgi:HSP20 family protein
MKRRSAVEGMFNDIVDTIKIKQKDLERTVNDYTSNTTQKPDMDLLESSQDITVLTDLPGVKKDDIKIDLTEDTLEITAYYIEEHGDKTFIRRERNQGKVNRVISLPEKINIDETSAKFENGVLTVVLSKQEKKQIFKVKVD